MFRTSPHREPTWAERLVAAPAPSATLESQVKRARLTAAPVIAGGGDAPVVPTPEAAPILGSSDDGGDAPEPDGEGKGQANSAEEAKSLRHLLTHLPKNSHCEACMRAKMVKKHARRRHAPTGPDSPTIFGDSVTADHLFSTGEKSTGTAGEQYAMVVLDLGTRWRDCYPSAERDATQSRLALQSFIGPRTVVKTFQCDGAKELYKAAVDLGICPNTSRPYVSQSNSIVERAIRQKGTSCSQREHRSRPRLGLSSLSPCLTLLPSWATR